MKKLKTIDMPVCKRENTLRAEEDPGKAFCLGLTENYITGPILSGPSKADPALVHAMTTWLRKQLPGFNFTYVQVNWNTRAALHVDKNNRGDSFIGAFGVDVKDGNCGSMMVLRQGSSMT